MQCSGRDATRALAAWRDEANFSQRLQRGPDGGARAHHARRFLVNALAAGCSRNCIANTKSQRPSPTPSQQSDCSTHLSLCSVMPASALQSLHTLLRPADQSIITCILCKEISRTFRRFVLQAQTILTCIPSVSKMSIIKPTQNYIKMYVKLIIMKYNINLVKVILV